MECSCFRALSSNPRNDRGVQGVQPSVSKWKTSWSLLEFTYGTKKLHNYCNVSTLGDTCKNHSLHVSPSPVNWGYFYPEKRALCNDPRFVQTRTIHVQGCLAVCARELDRTSADSQLRPSSSSVWWSAGWDWLAASAVCSVRSVRAGCSPGGEDIETRMTTQPNAAFRQFFSITVLSALILPWQLRVHISCGFILHLCAVSHQGVMSTGTIKYFSKVSFISLIDVASRHKNTSLKNHMVLLPHLTFKSISL